MGLFDLETFKSQNVNGIIPSTPFERNLGQFDSVYVLVFFA